jgi:thiol:disulfide interchange protein
MFRLQLLVAAFAVAVLALVLPVYAGDKSDSKVKAAAKVAKLDGNKQKVTITIDIEKDWYIYANPVKAEDFEDNRTRVLIKAKEKVDADVLCPAGKVKEDTKLKLKYNIYEKQVVIEAVVTRTKGDTSPLQVSIDVNSCSQNGVCLLPGTVKLTVP